MTTDHPFHDVQPPASSLIQLSSLILAVIVLTGCPPDNTPLIKEKEQLKKQIVKQETMMTTLQEGNRVLQEQVDRLNRELRDKQKEFAKQLNRSQQTSQGLSTDKQNLLHQATALTKENQKLQGENKKLTGDAHWLRKQRENVRKSLQTNIQAVKAKQLSHALPDVTKATSQALAQNGYDVMTTMETDKKAVFVTERKTSASPSIELPGFRNQYLVELEGQPNGQTALKVKAQYEKVGQGGKILEVGHNEVAEIENRLIQAIQHALNQSTRKAQKKNVPAR